jgi:hypothetical protein
VSKDVRTNPFCNCYENFDCGYQHPVSMHLSLLPTFTLSPLQVYQLHAESLSSSRPSSTEQVSPAVRLWTRLQLSSLRGFALFFSICR